MEEKLSIIDEIQVEYQKLFNECKPKHEQVKAGLDKGLSILTQLKESPLDKIEESIKSSIDNLISPILLISENKVKRIYVAALKEKKKIVNNSLITIEQSSSIIKGLGVICQDSNEEFVQEKIIETLSPMINKETLYIKEEIIECIIKMCLKFFGIKGLKFKVPLTQLLNKLIDLVAENINTQINPIIAEKLEILGKEEIIEINNTEEKNSIEEKKDEKEENNNEEDKNEIIEIEKKEDQDSSMKINEKEEKLKKLKENNYYVEPKISLEGFEESEMFKAIFHIFNTACQLAEGQKIENVYKGVHSKCLGYEILSLLIIKTNDLFIYFPSIMSRLNDSLHKELLKRFGKAYDYFTCVKITRLALKIISNLHIGYEYIPFIIKYAENTSIGWQK